MIKRYCGKNFTENDLDEICRIIRENPKEHRVSLSKIVCETFNWKKPDGGLKDMSCRVAMLKMEKSKSGIKRSDKESKASTKIYSHFC